MAQIRFKNPNNPEQPKPGVYRWYFEHQGQEVTLYVGRSKEGEPTGRRASTLLRGVLQASRGSGVSVDPHIKLDTDFIVGTALYYLKDKGFDCYWEHVSGAAWPD